MSKKHMGSSIDDFLKEEGIFEEAQAQAVKEVVAWQLAEAMKKRKISKNKMAALLKTSRTQVDRLLDPKNDITLGSLQRAAAMVGCARAGTSRSGGVSRPERANEKESRRARSHDAI
ncbi:MAG: XRE family transcriptional regulator [Acidobacteria bacterium]|nr:XRE family transcriptional regulator [Acidobacteriota bacterium]